jgi:hypothetical protein
MGWLNTRIYVPDKLWFYVSAKHPCFDYSFVTFQFKFCTTVGNRIRSDTHSEHSLQLAFSKKTFDTKKNILVNGTPLCKAQDSWMWETYKL